MQFGWHLTEVTFPSDSIQNISISGVPSCLATHGEKSELTFLHSHCGSLEGVNSPMNEEGGGAGKNGLNDRFDMDGDENGGGGGNLVWMRRDRGQKSLFPLTSLLQASVLTG